MNQKHMGSVYAPMHMRLKILREISLVNCVWVISSIQEFGKSLLVRKDVEEMVEHFLNWKMDTFSSPCCVVYHKHGSRGHQTWNISNRGGLRLLVQRKFLYLVISCQYLCKKSFTLDKRGSPTSLD